MSDKENKYNNNFLHNHTDDDEDGGLNTKIWGPAMWTAMHSVTFAYPKNPSDEDKKHYRSFFENLGFVLPCETCRNSYQKFIKNGKTQLTDEVFQSRNTLTLWLYNLHQAVNHKLEVNYEISYEDMAKQYESYRVECSKTLGRCVIPLDKKKESYKNSEIKKYPIVSKKFALCFNDYAGKRGIIDFNKKIEYYEKILSNKDNTKEINERNKECDKIVRQMKTEGISTFEKDGEFKGFPTIQELQLLFRLSTTMRSDETDEVLEKVGKRSIKRFKIFINDK
jgi:hypothetical protein